MVDGADWYQPITKEAPIMTTQKKSTRSPKSPAAEVRPAAVPALPDRGILEKRLRAVEERICHALCVVAVSMEAASGLEEASDIQGALAAAYGILSNAMSDVESGTMLR